jgi:hypothetical protein
MSRIGKTTVVCFLAAVLIAAVPRHVQNWMYACAGAEQTCNASDNVGVPASWMASHADWLQVYYDAADDDTGAQLAAAHAKHVVVYVDPNIAWYCPPEQNGANCTNAVSRYLHPVDGSYEHAYEHAANGKRLLDRADGLYNGEAGEAFYIGDPGVRAAFHAVTLLNPYATDVFEDDAGGYYDRSYWRYKYGETAIEWDRTSDPKQAYMRDATALSDASAHPVIGNNGVGTTAYDLGWARSSNVIGAMAEGAWRQVSDPLRWINEANAILMYHRLGKFVVEYSSDESSLMFQIASHWIVYDPRYSIEDLAEVNPVGHAAGLRDTTFPEETIVPTRPRVPTPGDNNVTRFETAPGLFVREYAACYEDGVAIGYCAAVVNATGSAQRIVGLTQRYTRVLVHNAFATWAAGGKPLWRRNVPTSVGANDGLILAQ